MKLLILIGLSLAAMGSASPLNQTIKAFMANFSQQTSSSSNGIHVPSGPQGPPGAKQVKNQMEDEVKCGCDDLMQDIFLNQHFTPIP